MNLDMDKHVSHARAHAHEMGGAQLHVHPLTHMVSLTGGCDLCDNRVQLFWSLHCFA